MKVLVLGATGHVGSRLVPYLQAQEYVVTAASRGRLLRNLSGQVKLDSMDLAQMTHYLKQADAVVNCVAGDKESIAKGAEILVQAAMAANLPRIINLSTMSVYGGAQGNITETHMLDPKHGWYAAAKCEAEAYMEKYAMAGGQVINFRPGCVHGPGSRLWVSRPANLLKSHRLGDLGSAGDGWSNLVHVDDVIRAIQIGLTCTLREGESLHYNLSAPDSPRWNQYLFDLAEGIGAIPIKRLSQHQLKLDSTVLSTQIKILQIACNKLNINTSWLPETLPPSLSKLLDQHIYLNSEKFSKKHNFEYKSYSQSLQDSLTWYQNL